jgi:hypothetical protein
VLAFLGFSAAFTLQRLLVVQMRWRNGWRTPVVARPAEFVTS